MMVVASSLFGGAVFIIALGYWFAVTVAAMTGIANVDKDYFDAARTLGATSRQLVFRVAIPHAMPSILQGCTQAMSSSCTAIMIAEMLGVKSGLGWYMNWSKSWASYDKMFAALFVICIVFTLVTKVLDSDFAGDNCCVIAMNRTFVQENPVHAKKIVQAVQKAHSWMRENPEEATTLLLDRGWNGGDYDMNVMINNSLQFGLAEDFTGNSLHRVVEKYVRLGLITSMEDVDEIISLA